MTKNKLFTMFFSVIACAAILVAAPAFANDPVLHVGGSASAWVNSPWNATGTNNLQAGLLLSGRGRLNVGFADLAAELGYVRLAAENRMQVSVNGNVLFLHLHELYIRRGGSDGEQTRAMGGIGASVSLPGTLGRITASIGAASLSWQRPGGAAQSMYGAYVGASLRLRIWKVQNELRVAYYASPQINRDYAGIFFAGERAIAGWQSGVVASERISVEILSLPVFSLGPELQAQVSQLPDGTEWFGTLGVGGNLNF